MIFFCKKIIKSCDEKSIDIVNTKNRDYFQCKNIRKTNEYTKNLKLNSKQSFKKKFFYFQICINPVLLLLLFSKI